LLLVGDVVGELDQGAVLDVRGIVANVLDPAHYKGPSIAELAVVGVIVDLRPSDTKRPFRTAHVEGTRDRSVLRNRACLAAL
jgi:hypothetical protein